MRIGSDRIAREKKTIRCMLEIYCRDRHRSESALCGECRHLLEYAWQRTDRCPQGKNKPPCGRCTIHCFEPAMRERIRQVMRHAGPRMMLRHPLLALLHFWDGVRGKGGVRDYSRKS